MWVFILPLAEKAQTRAALLLAADEQHIPQAILISAGTSQSTAPTRPE